MKFQIMHNFVMRWNDFFSFLIYKSKCDLDVCIDIGSTNLLQNFKIYIYIFIYTKQANIYGAGNEEKIL